MVSSQTWLRAKSYQLVANGNLFDFFVVSVLVAVGAELFEFEPGGGVATVLHGGVTRNTWRTFVGVGATLSTFQRNDDSYALILSHNRQPRWRNLI